MASESPQDTLATADQSTAASALAPSDQGGRPASDIRKSEFTNVGNSQNSSKRPGAKCKHCSKELPPNKATNQALLKHILEECKQVSPAVKEHWSRQGSRDRSNSTAGEQAVVAGSKRKARTQQDIRRHLPDSSWGLTEHEQREVSFDILRLFVTANVAFKQANNPHLLAALRKLRPHYKLPSPSSFQRLLQQEYLGVVNKLKDLVANSHNLTLALDGWTDAKKRSVIAFVLHFPDRTSRLLETREASIEKHTGEFMAGMIKEVLSNHQLQEKVAMLVTDNASNMVVARRLVIETTGFQHMLEMRCAMHGFNLVLKSVLSCEWAKTLVLRAQQVVTYFRASHAALAALRVAARELGINRGLQSSNTTRFTSSYACTSSVQLNAPAFARMCSSSTVDITNVDVEDILDDGAFWADLSKLNKVLAPVCKVIMVVQGDSTTLADICRCWLYLAHAVGEVLPTIPAAFQTHIIWAFSTRAKQQDQVLCRLALYLDPRFRQAATSGSSDLMAAFVHAAAKWGHQQGWAAPKISDLLDQLAKYGDNHVPFNLPTPGDSFSWWWWSTVAKNPSAAVLAELAGVLLDVVPHAAGPERVFSQMGWFEGSTSSSLATSTTAKKVAIKMHYDAVAPPRKRERVDLDLPDVVDLTGAAQISQAAAAAAGPAAAAAAAAAADQDSEEEEEEATAEQLGSALQQHAQADAVEQQEQEQPPEECRRDWRAAMRWGLMVEQGMDLLDPAYKEAMTAPNLRRVSAPAADVNPSTLAAQFLQQHVRPPGIGAGLPLQHQIQLQHQLLMQQQQVQHQLLMQQQQQQHQA